VISKNRKVFNPILGHLVTECETTSIKTRSKLKNRYGQSFCELCGEQTEYAIADLARAVFKDTGKGNAKPVLLSDFICKEAQREADLLVERYEKALTDEYGMYEQVEMLMALCDIVDMRGDRSVAAFRDQVERRTVIAAWARSGDLLSVARLPNQPEGAAKPSKLYCGDHNPRRSDEARRAYQRDRRFEAEYRELIAAYWTIFAGELPTWDIEAHAEVRKEAYRRLQLMKKPTIFIRELEAKDITSQAEIARKLGVSRQAVSAAIKRRERHRAKEW
jgi:Winged helix-turn-helix DNA-binding